MKFLERNQILQTSLLRVLGGSFAIHKDLVILALGVTWSALSANAETRHLSRDELRDRIQGGWAGQMIGVSFGAPTEFRAMGRINEAELKWSPDRVSRHRAGRPLRGDDL